MHGANPLTLATILISNLIPAIGVLYWDWDLFTLMLLYLGEMLLLAWFGYLKMTKVAGTWWSTDLREYLLGMTAGGLVYFVFIAIIFTGFLNEHSNEELVGLSDWAALGRRVADAWNQIWWPLTLFAASHGLSYAVNFIGKGEYRHATVDKLRTAPASRSIALHLAILAGCYLAFDGRDATTAGILVLVGVKTTIDLGLHLTEHARLQRTVRATSDTLA